MPTWILTVFSLLTVIIILGGAINFPYVPMFFGVHGAERYSSRGKLITQLIWLFPPVSLYFLYQAWTGTGLMVFAPLVYIAVLWAIKPGNTASNGPARQFKNQQENLEARRAECDYRWKAWEQQISGTANTGKTGSSETSHVYFSFFAPDQTAADHLQQAISNSEKLQSGFTTSSYENGSLSVYASVKLAPLEKPVVVQAVERLTDIAWQHQCELLSLDVMEDDE